MKLVQVLALVLPTALTASALAADANSPPQVLAADVQPNVADDHDEDEEDGADYPDDGSRGLRTQPEDHIPERLLPISTTEEKGLLGDWGDSAAEAED